MVHVDMESKNFIPVYFYQMESGVEPVREWLKELSKEDRKKIGEDIKAVQIGWPIGMPLIKKLGKDLWEVRTNLDKRIARVIFTFFEGAIVLLHGFIKKTQKLPSNELNIAMDRNKKLRGSV